MNLNRLTERSQDALREAQSLATPSNAACCIWSRA